MLREKTSKGQNSPDLDIELDLRIDRLEPTEKVLGLLLEHKELEAEISGMNSIRESFLSCIVVRKSYCVQCRYVTFVRWCNAGRYR